jgi:hypothetical protein
VIIVLALLSSISVFRYFGGNARVLARTWIMGFYIYLLVGPDPHDTPFLASLSRIGLAFLFLSDIIPALVSYLEVKKLGRRNGH